MRLGYASNMGSSSGRFCGSVNRICYVLSCGKGRYIVRGFHTGLCLGVPAALATNEGSDIFHWLHDSSLAPTGVAYVCVLVTSLILYFIACLVEPGYVSQRDGDFTEGEEGPDSDRTQLLSGGSEQQDHGEGMTDRKCWTCKVKQPLRARHCPECGRCVRRYDHHCPWIASCVGEQNHKYFWLFLTLTTVLIVWTAVITLRAFPSTTLLRPAHRPANPGPSGGPTLTSSQYVSRLASCVFAIVTLLLGGISVLSLWGLHSYLMVTNQTSWECMARSRITYLKRLADGKNPFDLGFASNVRVFLCRCTPYQWARIYRRATEGSGDDDSGELLSPAISSELV